MAKKKILITGGTGFVGTNLIKYLQKRTNEHIVIFDKLPQPTELPKNVTYVQGNILSKEALAKLFKDHGPFSVVYHLASAMPNKEVNDELMMEINVVGTGNLVAEAVKHKATSFIFTSSNVTYGIPKELPVTESTPVTPLEVYGRSKVGAEEVLKKYEKDINIQIFRCPVISGVGRLGLQAILFEFISENKRVYTLGDGSNKYQFVDVQDVCDALYKATTMKGYDIYTIGADEVLTLRELYEKVIKYAKSTSKVFPLPSAPALLALAILEKLDMSPLGVYQYNMMGRSIYADTTKIKKKLGWKPKMTNLDTFIENYKWYIKHKGSFVEMGSGNASPNKSLPKMKAFKLLKMLS